MGRGLIMSTVRENSEVFTRPPRPASYLCNSQNKGQESIKQTHAWLGTHACAGEKIIQSIMSREEQMNGITDIRRILCGFQSGRGTQNHLHMPQIWRTRRIIPPGKIPLICCLN